MQRPDLDLSQLGEEDITALLEADKLTPTEVTKLLREGKLDGLLGGEPKPTES